MVEHVRSQPLQLLQYCHYVEVHENHFSKVDYKLPPIIGTTREGMINSFTAVAFVVSLWPSGSFRKH